MIRVPGEWARKIVPPSCSTLYDVAAQTGFSVRWVRALVKRYDIPRHYVRRHVRLANGQVKVRYAAALPADAANELLVRHLAENTKRAVETFTARAGSPGRWRPHRRKGVPW
jgi:hypothetical protein